VRFLKTEKILYLVKGGYRVKVYYFCVNYVAILKSKMLDLCPDLSERIQFVGKINSYSKVQKLH